jgi:hypothetical protein
VRIAEMPLDPKDSQRSCGNARVIIAGSTHQPTGWCSFMPPFTLITPHCAQDAAEAQAKGKKGAI